MSSDNLANLAKIGKLKEEPPSSAEQEGLLSSARKRLRDAQKPDNELESRFDLAYNAAHALALAALRRYGYRSESRYLVFQVLVHTLGMSDEEWRLLAHCHQLRNKVEYEGFAELDEGMVAELTGLAREMLHKVEALEKRSNA